MTLVLEISSIILSVGWFISGVLFAFQYYKILCEKDSGGVSWVTFFGFALLNANAALYGYLNGNLWWLPGTILASVSCALITIRVYADGKKE